jgi:hypothetical protein
MLRLLERDPHGLRLRDLLGRFRAQELSLTAALFDLQGMLESTHREASDGRELGGDTTLAILERCSQIQVECDEMATDLVHVRMAIAGAVEELADHDRRRFDRDRSTTLVSTPA